MTTREPRFPYTHFSPVGTYNFIILKELTSGREGRCVWGWGSAKRTSEPTCTSAIYQTNLCLDHEVINGVVDAIWLGLGV